MIDHAEQAEAAEMRTERNERQQVWNRDRTEQLRKIAMNFAPNTDQNLLFFCGHFLKDQIADAQLEAVTCCHVWSTCSALQLLELQEIGAGWFVKHLQVF